MLSRASGPEPLSKRIQIAAKPLTSPSRLVAMEATTLVQIGSSLRRLIRVFPRRTKASPDDALTYFSPTDLFSEQDEVRRTTGNHCESHFEAW
jgi:hypothetical protein